MALRRTPHKASRQPWPPAAGGRYGRYGQAEAFSSGPVSLPSAWDGWEWAGWVLAGAHIMMAPYTKVEESFNVQAMHDFLYHGWNIKEFDHFEFPGVVPRTFLGALVVSLLSSPTVLLLRLGNMPKFYSLLIVRLVLGSLVLASFKLLRGKIAQKFGPVAGKAFQLILCVQFHLPFYCSRPLPNVFAVALTNVAYSYWLDEKPYNCLRILVFTTAVFRCDVLILLGPIGLSLLLTRHVAFGEAVRCCLLAGAVSAGLTVALDSLTWRRLVWPEGTVFFFNTAENKSAEWGVSFLSSPRPSKSTCTCFCLF